MIKMPHWPIPYGNKVIDLGLTRVKRLLKELGNPHFSLPPVVHIAGTNGKGSILAFLKTILEESHYVVHRYISPHLVYFNERIYLAGEDINDGTLYYFIEKCRLAANGISELTTLTFFEGTTVVAFLAFAEKKADILLLETGLGGRLDATNVIDNPMITIISSISKDHTEFLGNSLVDIAKEKAGIIKPNSLCIISWQVPEVMEFLIYYCQKIGAPCLVWNRDWKLINNGMKFAINLQLTDNVKKYLFSFINKELQEFSPGLQGIHQILNSATAVIASMAIGNLSYKNITMHNIYEGLKKTKWPARLEKITTGALSSILPKNWEIFLDGAHNDAGAEFLIASIEQMPFKPLYLIHGRTKGRDIKSFLNHFINKVQLVCCVTVKSEPRAENHQIIKKVADQLNLRSVLCDSVYEAVELCTLDQNLPSRILICGSLYLAGDVLGANI